MIESLGFFGVGFGAALRRERLKVWGLGFRLLVQGLGLAAASITGKGLCTTMLCQMNTGPY